MTNPRFRTSIKPLLPLLFLLTGGRAVSAQTAEHGPSMQSWRDSLAGWPDASLRGGMAAVGSLRDPVARLRYGWLLATAGERFDSAGLLTRAADQFYEVTVRRSRWVDAWYGLGHAKARLAAKRAPEVRSLHQEAGTGWLWGSTAALTHALQLDSTFVPATLELAWLAPLADRSVGGANILDAIAHALAADSTHPTLWVIAGRAARARMDHAAALRAFDRALQLPSVDSGGVLLEQARELFALKRPTDATNRYYDGARFKDSLGRAGYRKDIGYVADSAALAEWDTVGGTARPEWLRAFWSRREIEAGRPAGSRLAEHEARIRFALEHFARIPMSLDLHSVNAIYLGAMADVDPRGEIYIRHGAPDQTAGYLGGQDVPPNVSWLYYRPEGNLLLHFKADFGGWRLVTSLNDIYYTRDGPSTGLYESRMGLDPSLGLFALEVMADSMLAASTLQLAAKVGGGSTYDRGPRQRTIARRIEAERVRERGLIERAMHTDSDPLRFDHDLAPIVQVFGAGAPGPRRGALLVAVSLPVDPRLAAVPLPGGGVGYTLRLRVTSGDDSGHTTLDVDSLVRLRTAHPLAAGQHLSFIRSFPLPATGDQRVRLIVSDSSHTVGAIRIANGVPVPDLATPDLVLSDLIVGRAGSGVTWRAPGGDQIALNPLNAWTREDTLQLAFEVGGLETGTSMHIVVAIGDITADTTRPPKTSVAFDHVATGARTPISQIATLSTLRPGRYLLSVTVTAGTRRVRQDRRITIVAGER